MKNFCNLILAIPVLLFGQTPSSVGPKAVLPPANQSQLNPQTIFTSPGVATLQGGQWVGAEDLYNLSPAIGIAVEIIKPPSLALSITESTLKEKVSEILKNHGLQPRLNIIKDKSALPFLHLIFMVNPIEKGYFAYCAVRLFEQVNVMRLFMKSDFIWQAITWEQQELLLFPTEELQKQVDTVIQRLTLAFAEKFRQQNTEMQRRR